MKNTTPITMGVGKRLLEKMGWKEGEPLGKSQKGALEPINPDIRVNRQGLSSHEDIVDKKVQLMTAGMFYLPNIVETRLFSLKIFKRENIQ